MFSCLVFHTGGSGTSHCHCKVWGSQSQFPYDQLTSKPYGKIHRQLICITQYYKQLVVYDCHCTFSHNTIFLLAIRKVFCCEGTIYICLRQRLSLHQILSAETGTVRVIITRCQSSLVRSHPQFSTIVNHERHKDLWLVIRNEQLIEWY